MNTNWKNLRLNPPAENCDICVKVGTDYETYRFKRYSETGWEISRHPIRIGCEKVPENAVYIRLDEIR